MEKAENFLKEYWHATRYIGRLMLELSMAKHAYEKSYENLPSSCRYDVVKTKSRNELSPVERSLLIVVDQHRAEVESIERRLNETRLRLAEIEHVVRRAELTPREMDYVRLRYFENRQAQAVAQSLYCSTATCRRIRRSALTKVLEKTGG